MSELEDAPLDASTVDAPGVILPDLDRALRLLVFGETTYAACALPRTGAISIGRAENSDVAVNDPSISRAHARLHLRGDGEIEIEDLGSANGTAIRGRRLEPGRRERIAPGEVVDLGRTTMVVQRVPTAERPRRVWTHDELQLLLEQECARVRSGGPGFTLLRISSADAEHTERLLAGVIRPHDVLARIGAREHQLMLPDLPAAPARERVAKIRALLGERATIGESSFPTDAEHLEDLFDRASPGGRAQPSAPRFIVQGAMREVDRLIDRVAPSDISVLVLGETGAGKDVVASEIHRRSSRKHGPLLVLDCGALDESHLVTELFGYERGAFPGADRAKPGLLETAHRGTIRLDDAGELPIAVQAKLLHVIEEKKVQRLGSLNPRTIDVRFISTTSRDLENDPGFRRDLYFRLQGVSLVIPPLRERRDEIEGLARAFLEHALEREGIAGEPNLTRAALTLLEHHDWPGNVRELRNLIARAVVLSGGPRIDREHLPVERLAGTQAPKTKTITAPPESERERILSALDRCGGNQSRAAELLGISRATLLARLDAYGVPRPKKGRGAPGGS